MEDSGVKIGPMCICIKDHGRNVCGRLQQLRLSTGLVDLDIIVEEDRLRVHKVVLAAASKFFREQLTKANVLVPVILRLEDFGFELKRDAVAYIVEFIYCGEVLIPGESLSDVCLAAHSLGVYGLIDFLPNAPPPLKEPPNLPLNANTSDGNANLNNSAVAGAAAYIEQPTNYLEPSFSSVDPVLDDALSLLSRGAFPSEEVPLPGKLRVHSQEENPDNKADSSQVHHKNQTAPSKNIQDPSPLISVSTPQPAEWSDPSGSSPWTDWNCKQGAWTTPAESSLSPSKEAMASWDHHRARPQEPILMWKASGKTNKASGQKVMEGNWKGDLEVRKDLTLPSAPSDGGDNVFQEEDPASRNDYPIVHLDDGDLEMDVYSSNADEVTPRDLQGTDLVVPYPNTQQQQQQMNSHLKRTPPQADSLLSCPVCPIGGFRGSEEVNIHVYKEHGMGELFRCEECSYETSVKTTYIRHVAEHANISDSPGKTKMKCSKCVKEFKSKIGLKLHLKQHFNDLLHSCSFCEFKTPQKINLVKHLASKHKKSIDGKDLSSDLKCSLCPFECVAEHQLKSHVLRKHTAKEEMKFQCVSCDYATVERAALDKHIRFKHTKERPFMCGICGFSTHTLSSMARHKRAHLKSKPHSCKMCGASYADKKRLSEHMLSHSGEKPFGCDICSYKCRRKDNLAAHVKRVHSSYNKVVDPSTKATAPNGNPDTNISNNSSSSASNRESHIVGHVNQDGSIRPVVANPKPAVNLPPILDISNDLEFRYSSQSSTEDIIIVQNQDVEGSKDVIVQ